MIVAKVALIVRPDSTHLSNQGLYSGAGVLIVLSGAAIIVAGYLQHASVWNILKADEDETPRPRWPLTITQIATAGSLLLSALIVISA
jgi:hypothetical protein